MPNKFLNVRDYAAAYGVSPATVYAMCSAGKLPHVRLGIGRGTIRISEDAVMQTYEQEKRQHEATAQDKPSRIKLKHLRFPS